MPPARKSKKTAADAMEDDGVPVAEPSEVKVEDDSDGETLDSEDDDEEYEDECDPTDAFYNGEGESLADILTTISDNLETLLKVQKKILQKMSGKADPPPPKTA
jgi:hypothetical protein